MYICIAQLPFLTMDTSLLYNWIGKKIAAQRQEKNLSQAELAELVTLSRGSIANIEKGRQQAPLHVLWEIAENLNISIEKIIPIKNEHIDKNSEFLDEIDQMDNLDKDDKQKLTRLIKNL